MCPKAARASSSASSDELFVEPLLLLVEPLLLELLLLEPRLALSEPA